MKLKIEKPVYLEVAIKAARAGGRVIRRYFEKEFRVDYKGELDLVTQADRESEAAVIRVIKRFYPEHAFLAEESGESQTVSTSNKEKLWIIDPLDGTTNFTHSFPMFCVSIGLEVRGEMILGVVFDPIRLEMFWAEKGGKSYLNGKPIKVSSTSSLNRSLLVTGFAYNLREVRENNLDHFTSFLLKAQGVRRTGTAALDLCYVASGRFDGFWELNLNPWDTAAGMVIALAAGARLTDFSGSPFEIYRKQIVASNGSIHQEMINLLNK